MVDQCYRGETYQAYVEVRNPSTQALFDPTSITCVIRDADNVIKSSGSMTKYLGLTGKYIYKYNVQMTDLLGTWRAIVTTTQTPDIRIIISAFDVVDP